MSKVNYGFDAPGLMRNFLAFGFLSLVGSTALFLLVEGLLLTLVGYLLLIVAVILLTLGSIMFFYGIRGKFVMRDFMLEKIKWSGNEKVLDVGTGRGLFMIGAAKNLTTGKSIGTDIWNQEDLSGNTIENAYRNAELENVKDKVEIRNEDVRQMSFADKTFDVIFSMYCLHNIEEKSQQEKACFEIARVLKSGGKALIGDFVPTHDYANYFAKAGLKVHSSKNYFNVALAPMWMVEATKE